MKNIVTLSVYATFLIGVSVSGAAADVKEGCFCIPGTNKCLVIHGGESAQSKGATYVDRSECEK